MKKATIIIAGGTGFIGQELAKFFKEKYRVVILSRKKMVSAANEAILTKSTSAINYLHWDGKTVEDYWAKELEGAECVINLSGKSVNCRYTEQNKAEILDSRVNATNTIGMAISKCLVPPQLWINAASATIYRHAMDKPQDEYSGEIENDFSVQVCKAWEKSFFSHPTPLTRKACLRMAITLGTSGAMVPLLNLVKVGLGGSQGNGKQMFSWIHIRDICGIVQWLMENPDQQGIFNASAPNPVSNNLFMKTIRNVYERKIGIPAPEWLLKIGAWMIGTETELILKSRWVIPLRLEQAGFKFEFPELKDAIHDIIKDPLQKTAFSA